MSVESRGVWEREKGGFVGGGGVPEGRGVPALGREVAYRRDWIGSPTNRRAPAEGGTPRGCLCLCLTSGDPGGDQIMPSLVTCRQCATWSCLHSTACRIPPAGGPAPASELPMDLHRPLSGVSPNQTAPPLTVPHAIPSHPALFPFLSLTARFPYRLTHRLYPFRTPSRYFCLYLLLPIVCTHYYALIGCKKVQESLCSLSAILYSIRYERIPYILPQSTQTFLPSP